MNTNAALKTISITSDTSDVLRLLKVTFTSKNIVLSELMQNARRAGASKIEFHVSNDLVVVQDNGCGIDDFSVLLAVAKSGWEAAVVAKDAPYGAGFISALFSSEQIAVMSKGMHLFAATKDILSLKPIPVNESIDLGVTEIRLHGHSLGTAENVTSMIRNAAKGFPIPVFVNGQELERPHAIENLDMVDTELGKVTRGLLEGKSPSALYLQGLPIKVMDYYGDMGEVVHLDTKTFIGRVPDRESLLLPENPKEFITNCLSEITTRRLHELADEMSAEDFIAKYADLAVRHGQIELLNRFDCIPAGWVMVYESMPVQERAYDNEHLSHPKVKVIQRSDLSNVGVYVCSRGQFDDDLTAEHYVHAKGGYILARHCIDRHWLREMCQALAPNDFELISGPVIGEDLLPVNGRSWKMKLVEGLELERMSTKERLAVPALLRRDALYVTKEIEDLKGAVNQVTNFADEDDDVDEVAENYAISALGALLGHLLSNDVAALLRIFLTNGGLPTLVPSALRGKSFSVAFDAEGLVSVANA